MIPDRRRVLDAVKDGIPRGGPSEIAAHDLTDDVPAGYFEHWSQDAAERLRQQASDGRQRRTS